MIGRRVELPPDQRLTLLALFGPEVDRVEVYEYSWFARFHARALATTRRRRIYLRDSAAAFFQRPNMVLHEYCHVLKQWESGRLTVLRYLLEWFRRGYWDNRFEIEAREFADDHQHRFQALLARNRAELKRQTSDGTGPQAA
jgi:hypothetical protein